MSTTVIQDAPAKKRKVKDLPEPLSQLTDVNFRSVLNARLETDPNEASEVMVAYEASCDGETFVLDKLTLDQLRRLCKNVGVRYVNKCSKFQCRKALWVLAQYQEQRERDGASCLSLSEKMTNNIVRITNIVFCHDFVDSFLTLNDIKTRADHEKGQLPKNFWADVAEAMNDCDDDDKTAVDIVLNEEDERWEEIHLLDLNNFDNMSATAIRKKVHQLLKVRKEMKKNMTISGEHDSDPYNFVEVAMKNVGGCGLTILGCYYFYMRCEENPEVDSVFGDQMEDSLKGNTEIITMDSKVPVSNEKKRAYAAMVDMSGIAKSLVDEMKETNREMKENNRLAREAGTALMEKNRLEKQSQLISLAQHLGKKEMLEQILGKLASSSDD